MLNFAILVWLIKRYLVGPLTQFLDKRANSIKEDILSAESHKKEAQALLDQQKQAIQNAHLDAKQIREEALAASKKERDITMNQAKEDSNRLLESAKKDIQKQFEIAKSELKTQIGHLAISLSGQLIKKNLDESAQEKVVEEFLKV